MCKSHYIVHYKGFDSSFSNPTYIKRHLRKSKSWTIICLSSLCFFGISNKDEELDPCDSTGYIYCIPGKCPQTSAVKIAGDAKCSTKPHSRFLISIPISGQSAELMSYYDNSELHWCYESDVNSDILKICRST